MSDPARKIRIGLVTMDAQPWELEQNYVRLEAYVRKAAQRGAEVVVAPETILDGYVCSETSATRSRMLEVAQSVPDGPYIVRARELSRELGIHLVFGFLERSGEEMFNSVVMIDPRGEIIARYSKVHPRDELYITPGRALQVLPGSVVENAVEPANLLVGMIPPQCTGCVGILAEVLAVPVAVVYLH